MNYTWRVVASNLTFSTGECMRCFSGGDDEERPRLMSCRDARSAVWSRNGTWTHDN